MHIHPPRPQVVAAPGGRHRAVTLAVTATLIVGCGTASAATTLRAAHHLTPTGPATSTTPTAPAGSAVTGSVFVVDIQRFASMLQAFGNTLQRASVSPEEMHRLAPRMRRELAAFDRVTHRMARYTVDTPALERKRAAIVHAAPPVSRLGRRLIAAALARDDRRVHRTSSALLAALHRLLAAAKT